jgi:hypothetical protein
MSPGCWSAKYDGRQPLGQPGAVVQQPPGRQERAQIGADHLVAEALQAADGVGEGGCGGHVAVELRLARHPDAQP